MPRPPAPSQPDDSEPVRLQKFLASAGIDSRRKCEELIERGRVSVDGEVVTKVGVKVIPGVNVVRVNTEIVKLKPLKYYLLNKPKGVVCTHKDPAGRPLAIDMIPHADEHLFTVGRLDEHTEGMLLITNDGALTERLAHPRYRVLRTYRAQVAGEPDYSVLKQLTEGIYFREGKFKVHHVKKLKTRGKSTALELQLSEGQNREIRRLLAKAGHKVMHLQRVGFGPLKLGKLAVGEYRELTNRERDDLLEFAFSKPGKEKPSQQKHRVRPRNSTRKNTSASTTTATEQNSGRSTRKSTASGSDKKSASGGKKPFSSRKKSPSARKK